MKILFVTHYSYLLGANKSLLSILDHLNNLNVKVCLLCPEEGDITKELKRKNIDYIVEKFHSVCFRLKLISSFKAFLNIFYDIKNFKILKNKVAEFQPDIIYTNSSVIYHGYFLAKALSKKHIWHLREFGWEDYNLIHPLSTLYLEKLLKNSDAVVSNSGAISKHYNQIHNKKSFVVYNGIKCLCGQITNKYISEGSKIRFLVVGFLIKNKGHLQAIKAFEEFIVIHPLAELIIVGDGYTEYLKELKDYCSQNKTLNEKVFFEGFQSQVEKYYNECHYLLMYSSSEAFGRVTVEALQCGLPVIAYKSAGTKEIVENEKNGFLFDAYPRSMSDIAHKIVNPEIYGQLSYNARMSANEKFSEEKYVSNIFEIIQSIYNEK